MRLAKGARIGRVEAGEDDRLLNEKGIKRLDLLRLS
jgi:hypothetical protein